MMPQEALVYPLYYLAKEVGLYNTQLAVIIIFTVIQSAFGTYLLSSVLGTFPQRAAGGGRAGRREQVAGAVAGRLPDQSGRPSSVLLIFFFIWTWNEFFIPLVMLIDNDNQTVPVALGVAAGRPPDGRADDQRRRAARPDPRDHLLPRSSSAP